MKKSIIIIAIIVICFFAFLALAVYLYINPDQEKTGLSFSPENEAETQARDEALALKQANQDILDKAKEMTYEPVRQIDNSDHVLGNTNAPVEIIIYNDFAGPFFTKLYETINQAREEFGENIIIAYRHFPLEIHTFSFEVALAAECAAEQDKFWQMRDKLYDLNLAREISLEQFREAATEIDLETSQFNQCLDDEKYKDKIYEQTEEGKSAGVIGAPAVFINGEHFAGAMPFEDFTGLDGEEEGMKSIIERHLK